MQSMQCAYKTCDGKESTKHPDHRSRKMESTHQVRAIGPVRFPSPERLKVDGLPLRDLLPI